MHFLFASPFEINSNFHAKPEWVCVRVCVCVNKVINVQNIYCISAQYVKCIFAAIKKRIENATLNKNKNNKLQWEEHKKWPA